MISYENSVGQKVKITTNANKTITGIIHSYNPQNGIVSLTDETPKANVSDYKIIKLSFIKEIQLSGGKKTSKAPSDINDKFSQLPLSPSYVPPSSISSNFKTLTTSSKAKFYLEKVLASKKHISVEGREVFRELFKLLPSGDVRFSKEDEIIIFDNHLKIGKPFKAENCRIVDGSGADESQLNYITKIIRSVWERLESERKGG